MSRVALAIAGLFVALAQQPAAAHALAPAMCDDASQPFVLASPVSSGVERMQPLHASRNATELQPEAARALPSESEETPAWCVTPNDPRCSPRDTSTPLQGQLLIVPLCDFEVVKLPQLRSLDVASTPPSPELVAVRPGVRGRIERPPRSSAG